MNKIIIGLIGFMGITTFLALTFCTIILGECALEELKQLQPEYVYIGWMSFYALGCQCLACFIAYRTITDIRKI